MSATVEVMRNGEWHLVGQYHSVEQAIPIAEDYLARRDGDDARVLRSEFAVYVAFDTLAEAEAFADRLRAAGDWEIKAPNHPRCYGVTLTETEIILPRDLAFGKSGAPLEMMTTMSDNETTVCGCQIQHDNSGVGHNWRNIDAEDIPAKVRMEIEGEIIDGGKESCEDFVASNGLHYRW